MDKNVSKKIAVLSTSQCREDHYEDNKIVGTSPSRLLTELVKAGYTIYLVTTRHSLHPDFDRIIMEVVPEERRFLPERGSEVGHACAPGLIDTWKRVYDHFGLAYLEDDERGTRPWTAYRWGLEEHGILVNRPKGGVQ